MQAKSSGQKRSRSPVHDYERSSASAEVEALMLKHQWYPLNALWEALTGQLSLETVMGIYNHPTFKYGSENGFLLEDNEGNVDVEWVPLRRPSPLFLAITSGRNDAITRLILTVDTLNVGFYEFTPLHAAAAVANVAVTKMLLSNGATFRTVNPPLPSSIGNFLANLGDSDPVGPRRSFTPLDLAVKFDRYELIEFYAVKGAESEDILQKAIFTALQLDKLTALHILTANGAQVAWACQSFPELVGSCPPGHSTCLGWLVDFAAERNAVAPLQAFIANIRDSSICCQIINTLIGRGVEPNVADKDKWSPLHEAARQNDYDILRCLLQKVRHVDPEDGSGRTPLSYLLRSGNPDPNCIKLLLDAGADPNASDGEGRTPLIYAIMSCHSGAICEILRRSPTFIVASSTDRTPLHQAASSLRCTWVLDMMLPGPHQLIDHKDSWGETALMVALTNHNFEAMRLLLSRGASPSSFDKEGDSLLHKAIKRQLREDDEGINLLISSGANLELRDSEGRTPLGLAACFSFCKAYVIPRLLIAGASANARDAEGITPLLSALYYGFDEAAVRMLEHGATIDIADNKGTTPLHQAARMGCKKSLKWLLSRLSFVDFRDRKGRTPLFVAFSSGKPTWRYLFYAGANANITADNGSTPLLEALRHGCHAGALELIANGARLNVADEGGFTPLHGAAKQPRATRHTCREKSSVLLKAVISKCRPNLDQRNKNGMSPLMLAVQDSSSSRWRTLVNADADVNAVSAHGSTPLLEALKHENDHAALLLISKGAKIDGVADVDGHSPLHLGVLIKRHGVIDALVAKARDLNPLNSLGESPLLCAMGYYNSNTRVASLLIAAGADVNVVDQEGDTALHIAVAKNLPIEVVKALVLAKGALIDVRNDNGETPLRIAIRNDNSEAALYLINAGSQVDFVDKREDSILNLAVTHCNTLVLSAVVERVRDINVQSTATGHTALLHSLSNSLSTSAARILMAEGADLNIKESRGLTPIDLFSKVEAYERATVLLLDHGADIAPMFSPIYNSHARRRILSLDAKPCESGKLHNV